MCKDPKSLYDYIQNLNIFPKRMQKNEKRIVSAEIWKIQKYKDPGRSEFLNKFNFFLQKVVRKHE